MNASELKSILENALPECRVEVDGEGANYQVTVVGDCFEGLNPVRRQQLVYGGLGSLIADGTVHAVSIRTHTPAEYQKAARFNIASE